MLYTGLDPHVIMWDMTDGSLPYAVCGAAERQNCQSEHTNMVTYYVAFEVVGSLAWFSARSSSVRFRHAMLMKSKIEDYTLTVLKSQCKIRVSKDDKSWEYSIRIFKRDGMMIFPKPLYRLICNDLKYANIYDRFLDKFYTWDESDE